MKLNIHVCISTMKEYLREHVETPRVYRIWKNTYIFETILEYQNNPL